MGITGMLFGISSDEFHFITTKEEVFASLFSHLDTERNIENRPFLKLGKLYDMIGSIYECHGRLRNSLVSRLFTRLHQINIPYNSFSPSYFLLEPEVQQVWKQLLRIDRNEYRKLFNKWLSESKLEEEEISFDFEVYYNRHLQVVNFFEASASRSQMVLFILL